MGTQPRSPPHTHTLPPHPTARTGPEETRKPRTCALPEAREDRVRDLDDVAHRGCERVQARAAHDPDARRAQRRGHERLDRRQRLRERGRLGVVVVVLLDDRLCERHRCEDLESRDVEGVELA